MINDYNMNNMIILTLHEIEFYDKHSKMKFLTHLHNNG